MKQFWMNGSLMCKLEDDEAGYLIKNLKQQGYEVIICGKEIDVATKPALKYSLPRYGRYILAGASAAIFGQALLMGINEIVYSYAIIFAGGTADEKSIFIPITAFIFMYLSGIVFMCAIKMDLKGGWR